MVQTLKWGLHKYINLGDPNAWLHVCEKHTSLFQHVMLMDVENLVIAPHQNMLHYAICSKVVISLEYVDLNPKITCNCNK